MKPSASGNSDAALSTAPTSRIAQLDALRGMAVIGIAWMNVYAFALPLQAYYNPVAYGGEGALDRLVWLVSFVFIEDKFRTLFAMLFGAGCLILLEKDERNGVRSHVARMAILFVIGCVHSIALASNDVLRAYAMAGLAIPFMRGFSPYAFYALAIGLVAAHIGFGMVAFGSAILDFYAGKLNTEASLFADRNFGSNPGALGYALELGKETFGERVARRSASIPSQLGVLASSLPLNLAAMSMGMGLWRQGMLMGRWRTFWLQRLATICAVVSVPALLAIGWWVSGTGFPGAIVGTSALVLSAPFDTLLGLAYASIVMAFLAPEGRITKLLAAVGRLSLTNYILTSVVFGALFANWGLGWFGEVSRAQAFAMSFIPIALMIAGSPIWVRRIGQGPFEWAWRSAARRLS